MLKPISGNKTQTVEWKKEGMGVCACMPYLFDLIDEGVYQMFDLWSLGWEQDQFLIGQIKLQHIFRWDGNK